MIKFVVAVDFFCLGVFCIRAFATADGLTFVFGAIFLFLGLLFLGQLQEKP